MPGAPVWIRLCGRTIRCRKRAKVERLTMTPGVPNGFGRMKAMAILKTGRSHRAKKELFQKGLCRGFLTIQEIETALPPGALTAAERWLLYYSLRAAEIEVRDETGEFVTVPALSQAEVEKLAEERETASPAERADMALSSSMEGQSAHHS